MSRAEDDALVLISVAARLAGMHAQTLRQYDRLGLVSPQRTTGGGRRYTQQDIKTLQYIQQLSQDEGINLAGIQKILELTRKIEQLEAENAELKQKLAARTAGRRGELEKYAPPKVSTQVVVWTGRRRG